MSISAPMRASSGSTKLGESQLCGGVSGPAVASRPRPDLIRLDRALHGTPQLSSVEGFARRTPPRLVSQCYSSTTIASYAVIRRLQLAGRRMGLSSSMPSSYDPQTLVRDKLALRDTAVVFSKTY